VRRTAWVLFLSDMLEEREEGESSLPLTMGLAFKSGWLLRDSPRRFSVEGCNIILNIEGAYGQA